MPNLSLFRQDRAAEPLTGVRDVLAGRTLMEKLLPLGQIQDLYRRARPGRGESLLENVLSAMRIECSLDDEEMSRIPAVGSVLVVCNHPFGILDGAVLGAVMSRVRPDVKIVTNVLLREIEELQEHCIFVEPFGSGEAVSANSLALLQCARWLRQGGMLVMFPAGEVSNLQLPRPKVADPTWSPAAARLARMTGASTLPVYFRGRNRNTLQALGLVHPSFRSALLLNEFLWQKGRTVEMRIGRSVPAAVVAGMENDEKATQYLRWRTQLLAQRGSEKLGIPAVLLPVLPKKRQERLTRPVVTQALLRDIERLRPEQILDDGREFMVFTAREAEIPNLLPELGRLREVTFREAGEGTGRSTDLDTFDSYYDHVMLWHKQKQELVGAYRLGNTTDILPQRGVAGLYTNSLFQYDDRFFEKLGPAMELGRSFVRPEYQRQYAPLLLLWKGIARYVAAHPETPVLFGAVSISGRYTRASRDLIVRFFESRSAGDELGPLVRPRRPFRPGRIRSWDCRSIDHAMQEIDQLSDPIADMESDGKGVPILLKHYSRLGGRLLGFNVDSKFSHVLDGLVVMDLRQTEPASLERYMGKTGLASFRRHHGLPALQDRY